MREGRLGLNTLPHDNVKPIVTFPVGYFDIRIPIFLVNLK